MLDVDKWHRNTHTVVSTLLLIAYIKFVRRSLGLSPLTFEWELHKLELCCLATHHVMSSLYAIKLEVSDREEQENIFESNGRSMFYDK